MNIKVIIIITLTIAALVILYLFTLGPLYQKGNVIVANPESLKPVNSENIQVENKKQVFDDFHNKDLVENYYAIKLPQDWQLQASVGNGGYSLKNESATIAVELMDVPDNSTLELFILSQQEPDIKKNSQGYKRIIYQASKINGNEAYQLTYSIEREGKTYQIRRDYIAGADRAIAATLEAPQSDYQRYIATYQVVLDSIRWENK